MGRIFVMYQNEILFHAATAGTEYNRTDTSLVKIKSTVTLQLKVCKLAMVLISITASLL